MSQSLDAIFPLVLMGFLMVLVTVHRSFIPLIAGPRHRTRIDAAGVSAAVTTTPSVKGGSGSTLDVRADVLA